jgi:hypothetical protein
VRFGRRLRCKRSAKLSVASSISIPWSIFSELSRLTEKQLGSIRQPLQKLVPAAATIAAAISAGCGIFVLAMTLRMVVLGWSPAPFFDQWDTLVTGRALSWSWLVSQFNEHRLFVPRLIFWLDRWLAAETNIVDLTFNFLIQTALCGLLTWLALKGVAADKPTKIWAGGLCLALLFWAIQYECFLWGINVSFFGVTLFAASAFTIVAAGPATALGAASAVLLSGAAAYTLASGVLVPPLTLILGLWVRRPRWYLLILLIAAIGWPASYLWGYKTPGRHSDPAQFFSNFTAVWKYFFVEIGGPFTSAVENQLDLSGAAIVGAVGVAAFGGLLFLSFRSASPQQKSLAALSIFLLGGAFLTALGRVRFGPEQALSSRYTTPIVTFWLSSFLLWFSTSGFKSRWRVLTLAVGALIAMTAALSESRFLEVGRHFALRRALTMPALVAGISDPSLTYSYPPNPDHVLERRQALLQFHTSVFAEDWTRLMGANFADNFAVSTNTRCSGSFQRVQPTDETASNWSAVGTAWREGPDKPLRRIVLTTDDGRIVGYGFGGFDSSSVEEELNLKAPAMPVWWTGDFRAADLTKIRAYAVDDRAGACLIASNPRPSARSIALAPLPSPTPALGGYIDSITVEGNVITVFGWGYVSDGDGQVRVDTDLPVRWPTSSRFPRPDVVSALHEQSLQNSGFAVRLTLRDATSDQIPHRLCVWTDDPKFGRRTLHSSASRAGSPALVCDGTAAATAAGPADRNGR